jgi:hypothetical protein
MGTFGVLRSIGKGIAAAVEPLIDTFNHGPARRELVIALELEPRADVGPMPVAELEAASAKLGEFEDAAEIMEGISAVITLVEQAVRALTSEGDADVLREAGLRTLEIAGASRVRQRYPVTFAAARAAGVLSDDLLRIDWDRAGDVFTRLLVPRPPDAEAVPIDAVLVQAWIALLSLMLGKGFGVDEIDWLYGWDPDPTILNNPAQQISERSLTIAFRERLTDDGGVAAEALITSAFVPVEHRGPAVVLGLGGALEIETGGEEVDPATSRPVRPPGTRFRLAAPSAATMLIPLTGSPEEFRLDAEDPASIVLEMRRPPSDTKLVFPDDTRRRWEIGGIALSGGLVANDLSFELTVGDAGIVIDPKPDPDKPAEPGSELLDGPTRIPFTFSIGWTASRGFFISGGTPLGFTVPTPWLKLKGLRFQHVRVELVPPGGEAGRTVGVDLTTSASLDVGSYFHATVDRIGIGPRVDIESGDLDSVFIAPSGIGLRVDAKLVKGGGMLLLDRDRGEYAGAFEVTLDFKSVDLTLQAVVLYTTKLEGTDDSALLVSVSVSDFRWELGWGFSLTGVGGMIAVNHGYDLPALREGLRTGALEHVMFPDDPVRNAARIFQTLRTVFPIERDATTLALFFELSWGLGDVAKIRLGVLGRCRPGADDSELVILGSLDIALPTRPHDVLRIHADMLGVVNWTDGCSISVDAQLRDSHLLGIALTGSLALRLRRGGAEPMFLLSIGGFHPQFPLPPAEVVPRLDRVGFRLEKSRVRLSAEIYFAIAAATIQFGLRADLVVRGLGLRFEATLALDVIVETDTCRYVAELQVRAALKRGSSTLMGVDFYGRLEGTTPCRLSGKVTFKFWFIKKSISCHEPLAEGEVQQALVDARELLVAELASPRNWNGAMPGEGRRLVSIDPVAGEEGVVVVHPLGELGVRQGLLPLGLELDRVGAARPSGERRFVISRVSGIGDGVELDDVTDHFAAAQFLDLDEAAALSQPGFERMPAGVRARSDAVSAGSGRRRPLVYETIVIPEDHRPAPEPPRPPKGKFDVLGQFWAAASTERTVRGAASNFASAPERRVDLHTEGYVLVGDDLAAVDGAAHRSFHLARQELARDGAAAAAVVEAHEVRR